jgi:hypothetical protein
MAKKSIKPTKKKTKKKGPGVPQRSVLQEGRDALQLMQESAPQLLALQQDFGPQYAKAEAATSLARAQAERDGVQQMGTSIRDAVVASSPEIAAATDQMQRQLANQGPSDIETELRRQAMADLSLGGSLSADEVRQVTQGSRAAWSSRGLGMSQPGAVEEVMARTGAANARRAQRQQFAAGVDTGSQQRQASDRAFTLNAGQAAAAMFDPYTRMYGRGGGSAQTGQYSGPQEFQPYLGSAANVAAGNQEVAANAALAKQSQDFQKWSLQQQLAAQKDSFAMNASLDARNNASNRSAGLMGAGIGVVGNVLASLI